MPNPLTISDMIQELAGLNIEPRDQPLVQQHLDGAWDIWCTLTDRTWYSSTFTEYQQVRNWGQRILRVREIPIASITSVHNDYDGWDYAAGDLIAATNYHYDAGEPTKGVIYFKSDLTPGLPNSIKIVYVAGYTSVTLPNDIKRTVLRQASHWFKQNKNFQRFEAMKSLLDDFTLLVANNRYRRKFIYED
jgi:hypothetical protein